MNRRSSYNRRKSGFLSRLLFICLLGAVAWYFLWHDTPPLQPWHTEELTAEFSLEKKSEITSFTDYLQLEERLFNQLNNEVYSRIETGPEQALARYSHGSGADPQQFPINWNRSFELSAESPKGGILLLHGMSDSPYSLRALAQRFHQENYWVIGLRLPGHGTAPSGLKHVTWEDMAAAVRLALSHLNGKIGKKPIHIAGYSTGAPLALDYTLDALEKAVSPVPASLVLISPAIGIHPAAGLARLQNWLSIIPGLGHLAWLSIEPEFDPFKYNSFATNAGTQVHRITRSVTRRISSWTQNNPANNFPPVLIFKSAVDATVSTDAVVQNLLLPLGHQDHELVLFDINRYAASSPLLISDPGPLTARLVSDTTLPFALTIIANKNPDTLAMQALRKTRSSVEMTVSARLDRSWPAGVISLSHVALPFPPNDPLYGQRPPDNEELIFLGQMAIQGERGLLKISPDWLLRLRHNPFYDFLEERTVKWVELNSTTEL